MSWWHYLLLVNFYLVLFFGFYALLLRRETFFQLNRVYLIAACLLSFAIPLIQSDWVKNLFITQQVQNTINNSPVINNPIIVYSFIPVQNSLTLGEIFNGIYISVTLFLVLRLLWQLVILKKAIEKPSPSAAYSFFKKISLGENQDKSGIIAKHEQVHAREWHSADVMIIETVMIINWFNPVVYLYRFAIKYIHEFIADRHVVQRGTDKANYALLLLSQTFNVPTHTLVNPFYNHTLLKQRIRMLQKNKSHRIALAKYGLSAPLFMLMLVFSSATINNSRAVNAINKKTEKVFSTPAENAVAGITAHAEIPDQEAVAIDQYVDNYNKKINELKMDSTASVGSKGFTAIENKPEFPGSFTDFVTENTKYPDAMREANVHGTVHVEFIIEKDGSISHIKAVDGPGYGSEQEAERVMALSPKWKPAYQNGKPVKLGFTVPISFSDSQNAPAGEADANKLFSTAEIPPAFPGGSDKFSEFLHENIRYPDAMSKANVTGKANVQFVVEKDGSLSGIQVTHDAGFGSGQEAVRVLTSSPKWIPGSQKGKPVRVTYGIAVNFTLAGDNNNAQDALKKPAVTEAQPVKNN